METNNRTWNVKLDDNQFHPKVWQKDKIYPKMFYEHTTGEVLMDETPIQDKLKDLQIVGWIMTKE